MPRREKPRLSELESTVMSVVWDHGQVTAEKVRGALAARQPIKDSTVRTILHRLEEKGYVKHNTDGRTYVYSATSAPRNVAAEAVRGIVERFLNGSVEDLLVGMVDREVVTPELLRQLAQRIADKSSDSQGAATASARARRKES